MAGEILPFLLIMNNSISIKDWFIILFLVLIYMIIFLVGIGTLLTIIMFCTGMFLRTITGY